MSDEVFQIIDELQNKLIKNQTELNRLKKDLIKAIQELCFYCGTYIHNADNECEKCPWAEYDCEVKND